MSNIYAGLTQLGQVTTQPTDPDSAVLERVENPQRGKNYVVRFTCPEFSSICPLTGQPDFAHIVIDIVPDTWLVESKSLKLFLNAFRNHGAFHEACTMMIADRLIALLQPVWLRIGGYWYPRGGIPIDVFWQTGAPPEGAWIPEQGVAPYRGRGNDRIRAKALALGFDAVGFAAASLAPQARARLQAFLAAGQHGDMGWLGERVEERSHPQALWPEARSVISLGLSYAPGGDPLAALAQPDRGSISVYARNRDYHDLVKGMLKHLGQFVVSRLGGAVKVFVDTAPVMEKPLAQQAGLGWQGKHTNLVSRAHGSWLLLGEIYTSLDLPAEPAHADRCGSCSRCLAACPTDAFPAPYRLDATRCISYLTIEHPGPIPLEFRTAIGNRIYGCDDCLAVCPWNRFAQTTAQTKLQARPALEAPHLAMLAGLDDAGFRALFSGSPIKRIGRNRFIRNVLIAIGNSAQLSLAPVAGHLCADPDPVVAEAAAWATERLTGMKQ